MLALVRKPHIEMSISGDNLDEFLAWIRRRYDVSVLSSGEESVPVEETAFWREMEKNHVGNLLAGARLKAGFTQSQLAEKLGIRQNMISDYERGSRSISVAMAKRFSKVLRIQPDTLLGVERAD